MVPSHLVPSLGAAAHTAIVSSLASGAPGQSKPVKEPDFVAALVIGAMPQVAAAWRPLLGAVGISLQLQTVFCHGRPQVGFDSTGKYPMRARERCELADVLLVIDDLTTGAPPARRAVLVQAKMASSGSTLTLGGSDLVQLDLLESWPGFTFIDRGYDPRKRHFAGLATTLVSAASGAYGIIEPGAPDWRQTHPARTMPQTGTELGHYLAEMTDRSGAAGRAAVAGGIDDWSFTVDKLLTVTFAKAFGLASLGGSRPTRGNVSFALALFPSGVSGDPFLQFHAGGGGDERYPDDEGPGREGISSIRLIFEGEGTVGPE